MIKDLKIRRRKNSGVKSASKQLIPPDSWHTVDVISCARNYYSWHIRPNRLVRQSCVSLNSESTIIDRARQPPSLRARQPPSLGARQPPSLGARQPPLF
ncbi:hypothetical protein TNCV_402121 [Trichonephila clavipes]|nr:hypothetical protein TNCV_402121 [Trichonephila clavipes]